MDHEDILNILVVGYGKCTVGDEDFFIKLLPIKIKSVIKLELKTLEKHLIEDGLMYNKQILDEAINREFWSRLKEKQYEELPKKIEDMKRSIEPSGEFFARKERRVIEKLIKNAEKTHNDVRKKREDLLKNSIEVTLRIEEFKHLVYHSFYSDIENNIKVFEGPFNILYDKRSTEFLAGLEKFINQFDETCIRKIARDPIWFTVYVSGDKSSSGIWGTVSNKLSDEQLLLLSWSRRYESIYNDPDCPDEHIINDDKSLDAWIKKREEERKKDKTKKKYDSVAKKPFVKNSQFDRREVYIMSDRERAKEIYAMNDPGDKMVVAREQNMVKEKGRVSDANLRVYKPKK